MHHKIILASVSIVLFSQHLFASAKTDSIVAFLGGAHAKFVWVRWAWCNENFEPKTEDAATAEGMSLMLMDTREGTERKLISGLSVQSEYFTRISRSGKWATVPDGSVNKSYIVDLTVPSPEKRVLLESSASWDYWVAAAWWIDPDNGTEYVIAANNVTDVGATAIYKVKVNADGTADIAGATHISNEDHSAMDLAISLSADGKKLGAAFPWPDNKILDIATGNLTDRHAGGFGCQSNLAPDNSYRLFHCESDHLGLMMFGSDLSDPTNWFVNLSINLAGVPNPNEDTLMDFIAPRWSNHVQYLTATYPMGDNHDSYFENEQLWLWGESSTWVQNSIDMTNLPQVFIGKFSADFRKQEKSMLIASDPRYVQLGGDAWICDGITGGNGCGSSTNSKWIRATHPAKTRIQRTGSSVVIHTGSVASSVIRISDARGRVVQSWSGSGAWTLDAQDLVAGTYLVSVTTDGRSETIQLSHTTR